MSHNFHLDIITPISINTFTDVEYLRIPSIDGLIGIQAHHANAIIGIDIGEVKITINNKDYFYATSGGFIDIQKESVQLLLETVEAANDLEKKRAKKSLDRASERLKDPASDLNRAENSLKRARNRLAISKKLSS